jgi:hypothetical protein
MKKCVYGVDVEAMIWIKTREAGQAFCALMELSGIYRKFFRQIIDI